jgi:C4-type Zn-finger protein
MPDSPKQIQVSNDFKNKIVRWVKLDDDLRKIRETVKEINDEKKQAEEYILSYLDNIGQSEIAIDDGKLTKQVSKSQAPLKKENIQKALNDIVKDDNKASMMADHILKSRETKEKVSLRRVKERAPK